MRLTSPVLELKRGSLTDNGEFTAYAATFGGPPDAHGDIIDEGAFRKTLEDHRRKGTTPAMLWAHDQREPVGKWLHFHEDAKGLLGQGRLTLGTKRGAEAFALLKDDAVAFSIGYRVAPDGSRREGNTRIITDIDYLGEVSLVSIPANSRARLKKEYKPRSAKELERALRDVGLSAREAKRATAGGWRGLARDERSDLDLVLAKVEEIQRSIEEIRNA